MARAKRLPRAFYTDKYVTGISRMLLGKILCTTLDGRLTTGMIVETEAYHGPEDKASHAYRGRRTGRTEPMFGDPGVAYIYLCYGIHHLFNIVTGPAGTPHAILVRAVEPVHGIETMMERRGMTFPHPRLTAGPGSLTVALGLTTALSGTDLLHPQSPVWIEDRGTQIPGKDIIASTRVGVGYAGDWARKPWRFRIRNNPWTSPAR